MLLAHITGNKGAQAKGPRPWVWLPIKQAADQSVQVWGITNKLIIENTQNRCEKYIVHVFFHKWVFCTTLTLLRNEPNLLTVRIRFYSRQFPKKVLASPPSCLCFIIKQLEFEVYYSTSPNIPLLLYKYLLINSFIFTKFWNFATLWRAIKFGKRYYWCFTTAFPL